MIKGSATIRHLSKINNKLRKNIVKGIMKGKLLMKNQKGNLKSIKETRKILNFKLIMPVCLSNLRRMNKLSEK